MKHRRGPAAGAPSGSYHSYEHYSDLGNGSTAVTDVPVILDLDGDGVEIAANAQISFDWDGDGFLERGAWAAHNCNAPLNLWRAAA